MKKDVAVPVKNIFSKAALKMLNACAKFVYHFAQGFGIKFTDASGSVAVGIDTDNELFNEWLRCVTRESIKSQAAIDLSGQMADDFDAEYDTPPITPESEDGEYLWQPMTKDEENSTNTQTYYKGYKENAVIAIEDNDGSHKLWWVEKEYTPDGRLKSVSKLKGVTIIGA
jgi:hypothetical protein